MMNRIGIALMMILMAGCHQPLRSQDRFPEWLQGSWVAINSDEYHTMNIRDDALGFASRTTDLPEPIPVKSIERTSETAIVVTPNEQGWKYRFEKNQEFADVYDIRLEDQEEFFHSRFKRK